MLLVLGCGAVSGWLYLRVGSREEVLAVVRPVHQGQTIQRADLDVQRVSSDPTLRTVRAASGADVVGQVALVPLLPGSLLTEGQFGPARPLAADDAVVGLALEPGQLPASGLAPGDMVAVVRTPAPASQGAATPIDGSSGLLLERAQVWDVRASELSDVTVVDLVVPLTEAARVSRAQALGQASLALLSGRPAA